MLDICEVEPLRRKAPNSTEWVPDELLPSAFVLLDRLKVLRVSTYDRRFDVWCITDELSEGCDGPDMPEEIMV